MGKLRLDKPTEPSLEAELLVACARSSLDPSLRERIRTLANRGPDWNRLFLLSMAHGTRPLLYRSLSAACSDLVPADMLRSLTRHYCAVVLQNTRLAAALVEIIGAFQARAVATLPFKGPALAALAYGDAGLRECGDLDLLIRKRDLGAALEALASRQFFSLKSGDEKDPRYNLLKRERDDVRVDLQWMIADTHFSFSLEHDALWDRPFVIELAGTKVPGLSPEATLLVLCIHGSKHLWSELKWTCDVAELLVRFPNLDWESILRVSHEIRCRRMLLLGLLLARDMFNAAVNGSFLDRAGNKPGLELLAAKLHSRLRTGDHPHSLDIVSATDYFILQDKLADRMRLFLHICFMIDPADEQSAGKLPASFRRFYFGLRPFRLIGRRLRLPRLKTAFWRWID